MGLGEEDIRSRLLSWLVDEGHEVKSAEVPPQAPLEWSMLVTVKAPLRVNIVVQKPVRAEKIALTMGVKLSPQHQAAYNALPEKERALIRSGLVESLLHMCPSCIVIPQPPAPASLEGIAVTREVPLYTLPADPSMVVFRREVSETVRLLANAYQLIVEVLNSRLGTRGSTSAADTMHM
jgi:hypothetical protein